MWTRRCLILQKSRQISYLFCQVAPPSSHPSLMRGASFTASEASSFFLTVDCVTLLLLVGCRSTSILLSVDLCLNLCPPHKNRGKQHHQKMEAAFSLIGGGADVSLILLGGAVFPSPSFERCFCPSFFDVVLLSMPFSLSWWWFYWRQQDKGQGSHRPS